MVRFASHESDSRSRWAMSEIQSGQGSQLSEKGIHLVERGEVSSTCYGESTEGQERSRSGAKRGLLTQRGSPVRRTGHRSSLLHPVRGSYGASCQSRRAEQRGW